MSPTRSSDKLITKNEHKNNLILIRKKQNTDTNSSTVIRSWLDRTRFFSPFYCAPFYSKAFTDCFAYASFIKPNKNRNPINTVTNHVHYVL